MLPFSMRRRHTSHAALHKTVSVTIPTSRITIPAVRPGDDDWTVTSLLSNEEVGVTVTVTTDL